ncbi:MAG TPA: hypothetical protein VJ023_20020 [Pyrinomonadaceae bacterium]|nr:hypothetical protein [Pyrinomonadaceae bacterium]
MEIFHDQIEKERAIATNERARLQGELAGAIRKFSLDRELK